MKAYLLGWFTLIALLSFVIAGCSDDNGTGNDGNNVPTELSGAWTFSSVTIDGVSQDLAEFLELDSTTMSSRIILNADKTTLYEELDSANYVTYYDEGIFSINGGSLTLITNSEEGQAITPDTVVSGTWAVSGNQLTITVTDDSGTMVMSLTSIADVPAELVGTWTFQGVTLDGTSANLADFFEWDSTTVSSRISIYSDYTLKSEELDSTNSIVFYDGELVVVDGNFMTVTMISQNGVPCEYENTVSGTWNVSGNQLTITIIDDEGTVIITLSK